MKLALALATVVASVLASGVAHAERVKVAVVPGIAVNLDSARVDALSKDLADALAAELEVDAVGGLEVRRLLPAEGLPADCLAIPSCVADVAKRLDASQLLFVVMVDAGGTGAVQVDSTWVDAASGKSLSRPAIDVPSVAEARIRFAGAARQLLPDATVRAKLPGVGVGGTLTPAVPRHFATASYVTAGVAVVGLGIGIGFGLSARSSYTDCDSPGVCSDSARDSIRTKTLVADAGFLVAAAAIVATSILFATSGTESRLVVAPSPEGVSVAAFGRF